MKTRKLCYKNTTKLSKKIKAKAKVRERVKTNANRRSQIIFTGVLDRTHMINRRSKRMSWKGGKEKGRNTTMRKHLDTLDTILNKGKECRTKVKTVNQPPNQNRNHRVNPSPNPNQSLKNYLKKTSLRYYKTNCMIKTVHLTKKTQITINQINFRTSLLLINWRR